MFMDSLRSFTKWISGHRILSLVFSLVLLGGVMATRIVIDRSQGKLSDPIRKGSVVDAIYGIGTVMATRSYAIKPGIIASITELYVKEGDFAHKGARLAKIDNVVYRAPFDGVTNFLPYKVGENIFTQLPVMVFTDLENRYLVVSLEQQGALRVRAGQKAKLSFDSIRNQNFEGTVESVYSYNSSFLARIDVSSLPAEILPDMTADVAIVVRDLKDVLLIPTSALELNTVWVKRPNRIPVQVPVKLGVVDGTWAELLSGDVYEGDQVIIRKKVGP